MADELDKATEAYRKRVTTPGADFTDRVMAQVRRPRGVVVPRWSIPLAAAAMLGMLFLGTRLGVRRPGLPMPVPVAGAGRPDTVYVRFELSAPNAASVHVAGDFSGWQPTVPLAKGTDGKWVATVPVAIGVHRYQFVVDSAWVPDPAVGGVDDGFGGRNSVMVVGPRGVVRS